MLIRHDAFRRLCAARELLAELREPPLSIGEVARSAGMSRFHFIRRFEGLFGMTPHQYRMQVRMDRAKQMLAEGERSVTEVCMEVGMSSVGSFSGLFQKRVGVAPSEFGRQASFPGCLSLMSAAFRTFGEAEREAGAIECGHENQAHEPDGG